MPLAQSRARYGKARGFELYHRVARGFVVYTPDLHAARGSRRDAARAKARIESFSWTTLGQAVRRNRRSGSPWVRKSAEQ